ncbi:MAG: 2-amino-4-hydroxy-6-hydroxymethyldihydropteridine diphosphokinase [Ignavibacteriae bacterium]|nr:2-amino-4-hydroxy-6-hydroxymethyldihydropteridine diphosphokinase [Ignavibacteriota bacterium]
MRVFLGLGSNMHSRHVFIEKAIEEISGFMCTEVINTSSLYETEPWGIVKQNSFINSAAEIETTLEPKELLAKIKETEVRLGREVRGRWLEREIDIDILFYNDRIINNGNLTIPHSEIQDRKFVLIPLNEIAPDFKHPVNGKTISEMLGQTRDTSRVIRYIK